MKTTDLTVGAAADRVQGLQIIDENNVPEKTVWVASKDLNATSTKLLETHGDDAQQANPQSLVHGEANTNDVPDIQINGEPEAEHVNKDIMGPEDEEDRETRILQNSGNTTVGQTKKHKKKSKSKRGLVPAPRCCYRIITLIIEPRMHPLDSRNSMLTPR